MEKSLISEIRRLLRYSGAKLEKQSFTKDGLFVETSFKGKKYKVLISNFFSALSWLSPWYPLILCLVLFLDSLYYFS